ncbi:uncharacterized protein LY89DRAFT_728959 [Mollisia scopiformis]|uniref:Uncharacterized protein n=1 Tax=Mollisia scopiformis TaxID=149040 RepID=A0A194XS23_MOLSC|nr:uncharacterized protein LY89DRAFT_728959 [Mollisia scopiformis]KUJ22849.1 hypothetical protein LY89DRAFT_728959 [Mollisia scopiformis]
MPPASGFPNQSTAELASNTLWEYQLRKENKVILEQIRKIGEKRDADVSENMRRMQEGEKHRLTLEAKVLDLEKERKLQDARAAEHERECAAKMAEMEKHLRSRLTDEELQKVMSRVQQMNNPVQTATEPQPATVAPRPSQPKTRLIGEATRQEPAGMLTGPLREKVSVPPSKPRVANRRPSTRSNSEGAPLRAEPVPAKEAAAIIPKLIQRHKALKQYYEAANDAFESLAITDPQIEYDFIAAFLSGLENKKTADKVIQALMALHPARGTLDGGIKLMCGWEDVAVGFKRAGFDVTGAKEEIKRKKRTLNPRTQLETGFGN